MDPKEIIDYGEKTFSILKKLRETKKWNDMFTSTGDDILNLESDEGELYDQLEVLFSEENLKKIAKESSESSFDLIDQIRGKLKNYFSEQELYTKEREKYIDIFIEGFRNSLKSRFPETYQKVFLQDFRSESIRGQENILNKIEELDEKTKKSELDNLNLITCSTLNRWYTSNTIKKCTLKLFDHENTDFENKLLYQLNNCDVYLKGENIDEVVAYVAYLFLNDERFERYKEKVLIVKDEKTWGQLNKHRFNDYVFISGFRNEKHLELIDYNKCIFIYGKNEVLKTEKSIQLEKRFFRNLIDKLEECGHDHQEAYEIAIASRNNYKILMRRLLRGKLEEPSWTVEGNYNILLPALIINQWIESDRDIFELLIDTNTRYDEYLTELNRLNDPLDPFFVGHPTLYHSTKYTVTDSESAWDFFNQYVDESLYEKIEPMIDIIFNEIDSKFDLPVNQHYYASVLGYKSNFSDVLKEGFLETLVFLSRSSSKIEQLIKNKIKSILDNIETNKEWFSISESLPMIIEINPESVLDKLEEEVSNRDSGLINLFINKSEDALIGRCYYTHIVWSLEKAMYIDNTVFRSIKILATLMDYDIDYQLTNSPLNTLYNALVAWHHDYVYTIEEKVCFVDYIVKNHKNAWKLLEKLLPSNNTRAVHQLTKPKYSSFLLNNELKQEKQKHETFDAYYRVALENINSDIDNLLLFYKNTIFMDYGFYDEVKDKTLHIISECNDEEKYKVYKTIFKLISRHRRFPEAHWSQNETNLKKLENDILYNVDFGDSSYYYQIYFELNNDFNLNPVPYEKFDKQKSIKKNKKSSDETRRNAIEELMKLDVNWSSFILRLNGSSTALGFLLAEYRNDTNFIREISLSLISSEKKNVLSAYYSSLYNQCGFEIIKFFMEDEVLKEQRFMEIMLRNIEVNNNSLDFLESLSEDLKDLYWRIEDTAYRVREETKDLAIDNYILYKNASALLEITHQFDYPTEKLISALEVVQKSEIRHGVMTAYYIENIFKKIYEDNFPNEVYVNKVMQLEIVFMNIIDKKSKLKYLIYNMSHNPTFVSELIKFAYKSEVEKSDNNLGEKEKRFAEVANSILYSVKFSVTNNGTGEITYNALGNWCMAFIDEITENNQKIIGYQFLGQFLANTNELDGIFPQEAVKIGIEKFCNDDLLKGFIMEIRNRVGVRNVSTGSDYKLLSTKYRKYADQSKMYPKTHNILNRIADEFYREYEYEKESAKYET